MEAAQVAGLQHLSLAVGLQNQQPGVRLDLSDQVNGFGSAFAQCLFKFFGVQ